MPYAYCDSILSCGEIPYQSFGLDKNLVPKNEDFLARIFACGEDFHALRLTSELVDLRAGNANLVAKSGAFRD